MLEGRGQFPNHGKTLGLLSIWSSATRTTLLTILFLPSVWDLKKACKQEVTKELLDNPSFVFEKS